MIQFQMLYVAFSVNEYRSGKKKKISFFTGFLQKRSKV